MIWCVVDFEMTCSPLGLRTPEIIDFGAQLLNQDLECEGIFRSLVRPVYFNGVTDYCLNLTKLRKGSLEEASSFSSVLADFVDWLEYMSPNHLASVVFCSWGATDRKQLVSDCLLHEVSYPFSARHFNIREVCLNFYGMPKWTTLGGALKLLRMENDLGMYKQFCHHALSDAIVTANILKRMVRDGLKLIGGEYGIHRSKTQIPGVWVANLLR